MSPTTIQDLQSLRWERPPVLVSEVYGSTQLPIPGGYEVIAFRPPLKDELFLSCQFRIGVGSEHSSVYQPRLILRRRTVRKIVFTEIRRGRVETGEWARWEEEGSSGALFQLRGAPVTRSTIIAYRRDEIEENA